MIRVLVALALLVFANASLAHAAVRSRKARAATPAAPATAAAPGAPLAFDGLRIGAVPRTAEGRRALLIQMQRMKSSPIGGLAATRYKNSKDFGPALAMAELEVMAQAWNRPVSWVKQHYTALQTTQLDPNGKALTRGESVGFDDDEFGSVGIDLASWQPEKGSSAH